MTIFTTICSAKIEINFRTKKQNLPSYANAEDNCIQKTVVFANTRILIGKLNRHLYYHLGDNYGDH